MRNLNSGKLRRLLAALLVVVMACGLIAAGTVPEETDETSAVVFGTGVPEEDVSAEEAAEAPAAEKTLKAAPVLKADPPASPAPDPVKLTKTAEYDPESDSVKITLESYARGESIIMQKAAPTDIVLVVDLSHSMHLKDTKDILDEHGNAMYRSDAVIQAVSTFIDEFHEADPNGESYRISIVSFSGTPGQSGYSGYVYLFDGSNYYYKTGDINSHAASSLKPVNDAGVTALKRSIATSPFTDPQGDNTYPEHGLALAEKVLDARTDAANRGATVIMFTDGVPGTATAGRGYSKYADPAIEKAYELKNDYHATVYTIGLFNFRDTTVMGHSRASASNYMGTIIDPGTYSVKEYMEAVSSKYPNAQTEEIPGYATPSGEQPARRPCGLTPENNKHQYYHKIDTSSGAAQISQMQEIFNSIAETIQEEAGGASIKLDQISEARDLVIPVFTIPEGTTFTLQTRSMDANGNWSETLEPASGVTASVDPDNSQRLNVTGFNYSENWVGQVTNPDGSKSWHQPAKSLVVTFHVKPIDGYLGGTTESNEAVSGLYASHTPDATGYQYNRPAPQVPARPIPLQDVNIYQGAGDTMDALVRDALIRDNTLANILDGQKNAAADVTFEVSDGEGNTYTFTVPAGKTLADGSWDQPVPALTKDTYTVKCTVKDARDGTNKAESTAVVNVFKPVVTFEDQWKYYGDSISFPDPAVKWTHGSTESTSVDMYDHGTGAPAVSFTQTPADANNVKNGYVNATEDFPMKAVITIAGSDVTAQLLSEGRIHRNCTAEADVDKDVSANQMFVVHVKTVAFQATKLIQGMFASKTLKFDFTFTVKHAGLGMNETYENVSLGDNESWGSGIAFPKGAVVTVQEVNVPDKYEVQMGQVIADTETVFTAANPQDFTLTADETNVEVKNILQAIPITGVLAGHGPEVLLGFFAALTLAGFITVKVLNRRYER